MKKILLAMLLLSFSLPVMAYTDYNNDLNPMPIPSSQGCSSSQFSIGAYGGYGLIRGAEKQNGRFVQSRLSLGFTPFQDPMFSLGLEAGVQSGNSMRLSASSDIIGPYDPPIESTLKPMVDLLLTVKGQLLSTDPLFFILKGGFAYRQLVLEDRASNRDSIRKLNPEVQAGLGVKISRHVMLSAFYQHIFSGSNAGVALDASRENMTIRRIPTQQSVFIGFEYFI